MKRGIDIEKVLHGSIVLTVSAASLILSGAEEARWPAAATPLFAILTYVIVDRRKLIRLSVPVANLLGVIAFAAMAYEFTGNTLLGKLLSGAHLLVYMTWVVLLMSKGIRQFWWLTALSTLQLSVASVLTNSPAFGAALVGMLLIMIWTLSVFTLYRARIRIGIHDARIEDSLTTSNDSSPRVIAVKHGLQLDSDEPWIGWRFFGMTGSSFVASLTIAVIAFAVFPRFWVNQPLGALQAIRQALPQQTGFTESVQLGEIGEIMQSNERALQFRITRMGNREPVDPQTFADAMRMDEIMFRGNALGRYDRGTWTSGSVQGMSVGDLENPASWFDTNANNSDFRVQITQDPPIATFVFAPTPVMNAQHRHKGGGIRHRRLSYSLIHHIKDEKRRAEPLAYEIWCSAAPRDQSVHSPKRHETGRGVNWPGFDLLALADRSRSQEAQTVRAWCITKQLEHRLPQLHQLAHEVCSENGQLLSESERVRRIHKYLSLSAEFTYTLTAEIDNPSIDPIEDFLINRKSGHCEYFASAGALMLQAVDVPARVINGYKGCELNSVTGQWEVRQKHAHTWIEAYVDRRWQTVDTTPAARGESVGQQSAFAWWTDLTTAMNDAWFSLVQKMSLQQQEQLVRPMIDSAREAWQTVREKGVWTSVKLFFTEVVMQPKKWISWQFWLITFVALLIPALVLRRRPDKLAADILRRLISALQRKDRQQRTVVRFYENFCNLCAKHGLRFPSHQTAQENAEMAVLHFGPSLQTNEDKCLPSRIADTFNAVRFGRKTLSTESVAEIRGAVTRLSDILNQRK